MCIFNKAMLMLLVWGPYFENHYHRANPTGHIWIPACGANIKLIVFAEHKKLNYINYKILKNGTSQKQG